MTRVNNERQTPAQGEPSKTCRRRTVRAAWLVVALLLAGVPDLRSALASPMRSGGLCRGAWGDGYAKPQPPEKTQAQRQLAEKGDAQAQFFMAVATEDRAESDRWLALAVAQGSKGAAAYYAYRRDPRLAFYNEGLRHYPGENCWWPRQGLTAEVESELLGTLISAAEAGEPQPATWLWQMVVGETRAGDMYPDCPPSHPLLKPSDAPKWAEIAARGGNPWAQEQLCWAYTAGTVPKLYREPDPEWGFKPDPAKAYHWCAIAAQNDCASQSLLTMAALYRHGIGVEKSPELENYWRQRNKRAFATINRSILVNRATCDVTKLAF